MKAITEQFEGPKQVIAGAIIAVESQAVVPGPAAARSPPAAAHMGLTTVLEQQRTSSGFNEATARCIKHRWGVRSRHPLLSH